jgi:class 3 adenylate cyclase/predicted ATPase
MTFDEILGQVLQLLQRQGRVSYRALKRRFNLDDEYLEDLKAELIKAQRMAVDEDGEVLVWTGSSGRSPAPGGDEEHVPSVIQAAPPRAQLTDHTIPSDRSPAQRGILEAERRQLTVLFCDLVDSTALARQLDPEEWREVVRAYQEACAKVIAGFEGHIAQYLGDGLLVYFGYPRAHEDDAQRAVRAGLGMVEALGQLNTRLAQERGIQLAVRLGIHTGLVVVGEIGGGGRQEQLALGDTPNVAARIQGLAAPNTVAMSEATSRLVQGYFTVEALGPQSLKGVATPVPVYRVLGESGAQSRLEVAAATGLTPLVGRTVEVTLLLEHWAQSTEGLGQVVLLRGEAGIGKSRLVEVLHERVAREHCPRIAWRCSPYHTNSALYPVLERIQRLLHFRPDDAPAAKLARLEQGLAPYRLPLAETVPLLAAWLSLPHPEAYPPLLLDPQRQRQKTQEALVAWLLAEAERQPVLVVGEDLHWADPSTLEWLGLFMEQVPMARVLTLLTCRPEFRPPWPPRSYLTQLTLPRLPRSQVEEMVRLVAGGKPLPAEVVQPIVVQTDGVPLYVEEMTKLVLESGLVQEREDRYALTGPLPARVIPTTLRDALMARLDRLTTAKAVAQLGATLGRTFNYDLLHAVSQLDEVTLQRELGRLVEAELLYQRGQPPQATYLFKHALIQEAAYQSLLKSTRQQYHQRSAQVLAAQFPETVAAQPELLAHHYAEAGLMAQAIPYWQQAGQRALERSATLEAVAHLTKGLEGLATLPDTPKRAQQELVMQITLGPALMNTKGFEAPEVLHAYTRAHALCQQVGDARQLFAALWGLFYLHAVRGEMQRGREVGEELLGVAQRLQDPGLLVVAHRALVQTLFWRGELGPARTHAQHALALYDPQQMQDHAVRYGQDPIVYCRLVGAVILWLLGYPDQVLQWSEAGLTQAQGLRHAYTLQQALCFSALLHLLRREAAVAQERAEAQRALCSEQGFASYLAWGTIYRGAAVAAQGAWAEGLAQLREGLAAYRVTARRPWLLFLGLLAEACGRAGQVEEGLRALREALEAIQTTEERICEAEVYRLRGQLLLQSAAQQGEAEAWYQQALEIARRQQAKSLELRAAMSLSRLWQRQGKRAEARQLLAPIYDWFTEGFDTADLQEAKALLEELG